MSFVVPDHARLEIKFVCDQIHRPHVRHWLRLHPAGLRRAYPDRWVNNVYFDDHDYETYEQNLSGGSSRNKVRYRWYGQDPGIGPGVLEIKRKRNMFGWKLAYRASQAPATDAVGARWHDVRRRIGDQLPAPGRRWLVDHPFPVLLNRYQREYLISADGRVRVTLDRHHHIWDQRWKSTVNTTRSLDLSHRLVVEFKFARQDRDRASDMIQGFPLRVSRHSKYMTGVLTAHL